MTFVGIDFSMNSTGICVETEDGKNHFINFTRKNYLKRNLQIYQDSDLRIIELEKIPKDNDYDEREYIKLRKAKALSNHILDVLKDYGNELIVAIEGFSYAGVGNAILDIVGFQYALRIALLDSDIVKEIHFYPPTTVKKFAIKGNASKEMMVQAYLDLDNDTLLDELKNKIEQKDLMKTPFNDLVDAYFIKEMAKK